MSFVSSQFYLLTAKVETKTKKTADRLMSSLSFFHLFSIPEVCLSSIVLWQEGMTPRSRSLSSVLAFGRSLCKSTSYLSWKRQEKKDRGCEKKSIGFHYPVGQCHWRVSDPATLPVRPIATDKRKACWQCARTSQNTDLHFKSAKGHHMPRGHAQGARRSMGWRGSGHWIRAFLERGWGVESGLAFTPYPPPRLSDCLTSLH